MRVQKIEKAEILKSRNMNWKVNSLIPLNYNISRSIEKKINKNIYYVIELFKSSCDGLDWESFLQEVFPEFYLRKNPERCKEIIFELEEITKDDFKRDYLSPIHEYALYHLLQWWIDVTDVEMEAVINGEEIVTEDDEFWSEQINDIEGYKGYFFEDWDFLNVSELLEAYKMSPKYVEEFLDINLDDYFELMPDDVKKDYLERKKESSPYKNANAEKFNSELDVIKIIYNVLNEKDKRPTELAKLSEVELSNSIFDAVHQILLERNIHISREEPAGFAKKKTGELDFYGHRYNQGIYEKMFVGENKEWGRFESSLKQLIGYMDSDVGFGFTIVFNKTAKLDTVLNSRKAILHSFNIKGHFKVVGEIEEIPIMKNVLITTHENPEIKGNCFNISPLNN